jgi:hypothetical protein
MRTAEVPVIEVDDSLVIRQAKHLLIALVTEPSVGFDPELWVLLQKIKVAITKCN